MKLRDEIRLLLAELLLHVVYLLAPKRTEDGRQLRIAIGDYAEGVVIRSTDGVVIKNARRRS